MVLGLGWDAWFTAGLVVVMLVMLASGRFGADTVVGGALGTLLIVGVITPGEALAGFANPGVVTVGLLYVVAAGLKETGAIGVISSRVLGRTRSEFAARARLCVPLAGLSAFANNTPIVATFLPAVSGFSRRSGIAAGKLMMPLSFATILGGLCTLVGTSTTIVVAGLLLERAASVEGSPVFSMFTLTPVGLPIAIIGIAYIVFMGGKLLPSTGDALAEAGEGRSYTVNLRVTAESAAVGKTIEQAGLRHLTGLFLSRIERGDEAIVAVGPDQVIHANDVLVFVGALTSVVELQAFKGLVPTGVEKEQAEAYRPGQQLVEAVVSPGSPLVNRTIREAGVRSRYDSVVVAVHRHGHQLEGKIGDIRLRAGDTLLLEAGSDFASKHRDSGDFYLVNEVGDAAAPRHERRWVAVGVVTAFVAAISIGGAAWTLPAAFGAAMLMVGARCCTAPQARRSIDWPVLVVIGSAFGIGAAMRETGLAPAIAHLLVEAASAWGPIALLAVIYVATVVFTTFVTNNAAAVLMFPIAVGAAEEAGVPVLAVAVIVAIASSAEFTTPIGYQTNLMVAGPGGYRWSHYLRFGGPLTVIAGVVGVLGASVVYGLF
ncbi:MAG: SLC13 family permease [Planctomycetota bacterium]